MRKTVLLGVAGVGFVWFVIGWIKAHGFLDFVSLVFIIAVVMFLSLFTFVLVRGEAHG